MKLLFERLASDEAAFDLKSAVLANVQRLVSNRAAPVNDDSLQANTFDVLTVGVPSVVELENTDRVALERYGNRLCALILHYEPRLREPRVHIEAEPGLSPHRLMVSGMLASEDGMESVRFPVGLRAEG